MPTQLQLHLPSSPSPHHLPHTHLASPNNHPKPNSPSSVFDLQFMSSPVPPLPSNHELESIRLLPLTPRPRLTDPSHIFQKFSDAFPTTWISKFLLTPDLIHLPHLASPHLVTNSLTCTINNTMVRTDTTLPTAQQRPCGNTAITSEEHLLFLPVFSVDLLTVGFGVSSKVTRNHSGITNVPPSDTSHQNIRFFHDAQNRTLILLKDNPDQNTTTITVSQLTPTHSLDSIQVQLIRTAFRQIITRATEPIDWTRCFPFVTFLQQETSSRTCLICASNQQHPCICHVPLPTQKHPFDFFPFMTALIQDFGAFDGIADRFTCSNGQVQEYNVWGTRTSKRDIIAPDLVQRLSDWSLSQTHPSIPRGETDTSGLKEINLSSSAKDLPEFSQEDLDLDLDQDQEQEQSMTEDSEESTQRDSSMMQTSLSTEPATSQVSRIDSGGKPHGGSVTNRQERSADGKGGRVRKRNDVSFEDLSEASRILRQLKAVERRDRNRAAATKCNQRRKDLRERLRLELAMSRERICVLREREMRLRRERSELLAAIEIQRGVVNGSE